ncbi:hypothetical protein [Bremerella sp.]|uniref:hypothetical protein n=1 Tax=Bremerella sp. TaxID=2795602 RepID=UPI00391D0C1D
MTNDDSPFRSPSLESTQPVIDEEARLLRIVLYERLTMFSLWMYAGFSIIPMALAMIGFGIPSRVLAIPFWCYILISTFIVFRLAQQLYSLPVAILCGLLMLTAMLALIALVVVINKAVRELNNHGLEPGFLGLSQSEAAKRLRARRADQ